VEQPSSDETSRDGLGMSVVTSKDSPTKAARRVDKKAEAETEKARCLCGKWWAYRGEDSLVLRCKLCRRDIVITGENLKITYR
jgi:hypothetical protein